MTNFRLRGDRQKPTAAEVNRWNGLADKQARGELRPTPAPTLKSFDPSSRIALCKNTSGSDRQAFETMAIDGLLWDLEETGTADIIFELITADPELATAILLEPIESDGFGRAVIDGPAIAKVETSDDAAYRFATPQASTHSLVPTAAGPIKLLAAPSESADVWMPVIINYGTGGPTMLAGQINANFTGAPATFAIKNFTAISGAAPDGATLTVTNRFAWDAGDVNANVIVVYDPEADQWVPLQMECPA